MNYTKRCNLQILCLPSAKYGSGKKERTLGNIGFIQVASLEVDITSLCLKLILECIDEAGFLTQFDMASSIWNLPKKKII